MASNVTLKNNSGQEIYPKTSAANVFLSSGVNVEAGVLPVSEGIPQGAIIMWNGATAPTGWALCNGSNGTPDLRNRFIIGAGSTYSVGGTGGSTTAKLVVANMPAHAHSSAAHSHTSSGHTHTSAAHTHTSAAHTHTFTGTGTGTATSGSAGAHTHSLTGSGYFYAGTATTSAVIYVGSGSTINLGAVSTASAASAGAHTHSVSMDLSVSGTTASRTPGASGSTTPGATGSTSATIASTTPGNTGSQGSGTAFTILNPYYALAFIMKL